MLKCIIVHKDGVKQRTHSYIISSHKRNDYWFVGEFTEITNDKFLVRSKLKQYRTKLSLYNIIIVIVQNYHYKG